MSVERILLVLVSPVVLPFLAYLAGQIWVTLRLRGRARRLSLLPVPFMAIVLVVSVVFALQGSNLWPIYMIVASPVALLYLAWIYGRGRQG